MPKAVDLACAIRGDPFLDLSHVPSNRASTLLKNDVEVSCLVVDYGYDYRGTWT